MKNFWFWLIVVFVFFCAATVTPPTKAQDLVSPNLVYMTTNPWQGTAGTNPGSWTTNFTSSTTATGGGLSGGSQPVYNTETGTFIFGYSQATIAYTYALSTALQNSGMTWTGYNYTWDYINQDMSRGNLSANVSFNALNGTSLYSKSWTLGATTGGWTTMSGTENFTSPGLAAASLSNFKLSFTGKDDRFWAGYYGPQVRNPSLTVNYTFDACSANPLSSPTCAGYAAAYLTQQCTANPLYDPSCPGYAAALLTQQCTANPLSNPSCPGYATAYLNYQCSINPLYSTTCTGYEQAYFNQQCDKDGLYSKQCPNYSTAYATKMLLEQQGMASTVATAGVVASTAPTTTTSTSVSSDGSVSTTVSKTGDTNVDKAITPTTTTANSAAAPAAPVQLVQPAPSGGQQQGERKPDDAKTGTAQNQPTQTAGSQDAKSGEKPKTARQELTERRQEAAKKEAVEKGKNLANEMGKVSDMESQKQVQNVVLQAMAFVPGFDAYGKATVPDAAGYRPFTVYNNQKTIDNARLGRGLFGATDRLHNELVESQYERK